MQSLLFYTVLYCTFILIIVYYYDVKTNKKGDKQLKLTAPYSFVDLESKMLVFTELIDYTNLNLQKVE